jgi:hypothetical protein
MIPDLAALQAERNQGAWWERRARQHAATTAGAARVRALMAELDTPGTNRTRNG